MELTWYPYDSMASIDCRGDTRTVAMFGLHGFSQSGIVGPELEFDCAPLHGKSLLESSKQRPLPCIERQFMMQDVVDSGAGRCCCWKHDTTHENTSDRSKETGDEAKRQPRRIAPGTTAH